MEIFKQTLNTFASLSAVRIVRKAFVALYPKALKTLHTRKELAGALSGTDAPGVGFVPTMGALHHGHMSLVERARAENPTVVVSLFVNPTQFNDPDDLHNYPRTPEDDLRMLEEAGADIVFMPPVEEMYPEPDTRVFDFGTLDKVMEGATRPGHFNGVAQVVSRLFEMVSPARAYFGQKDFQQVAVIREMVRQLGLGVQVEVCPIVREPDGLALSSRNALLTPNHREAAPTIYRALLAGAEYAGGEGGREGEQAVRRTEEYVRRIVDAHPLLKTIYFSIVNAATLLPARSLDERGGVQGCIAVQAGKVRLIDNISFV